MDGQWTDRFLALGCRVTVVEGAKKNMEYGRGKYAGRDDVAVIHSTFETFEPGGKFDCIHMGGMLKHLEDPVALLRRSRGWLNSWWSVDRDYTQCAITAPSCWRLHGAFGGP